MALTGAAFAGNGDGEISPQKEIDAVLGAKTSTSQAIAAAEQATGGKAFSAGIDDKDGVLTYEVKTAKTGALQMVPSTSTPAMSSKLRRSMPRRTRRRATQQRMSHAAPVRPSAARSRML